MEHRCSVRKSLILDVVLNCRSLGLVGGRTRDIGMGGMFVDIGRIQLPMNALVESCILLESDGQTKPFRTEAMVVHTSRSGVGLMFSDLSPAFHQRLHELVFTSGSFARQETVLRFVS